MPIKQLTYILLSSILIVLAGCSSKAVKREIVEVKAEQPPLKAAVIEKAEDNSSSIDYRAYNDYVNGLIYESLGDFNRAVTSYRSALRFHPESYQLRFSLAESYLRLKMYDQAIVALDGIQPVDADVYMLRGMSYSYLGQAELAQDAFLSLVAIDSNNSMAYSHIAGHFRQNGDIDSLIWAYNHLARIRPDNERIWRELGRLHGRRGNLEASRDAFQNSINARSDETNILSYLGLAEVYLQNNQPDSAIKIYKEAVKVEPRNTSSLKELANAYVRVDSLEQAIPYAKKLVELAPMDRGLVRRLAVLYYGLDSLHLADSIFTSLVDSGERNSINHFYLGRIAVINKDFRTAVIEFTTLTQLADTLFESWLDLGYAYRKLGELDKEILSYQTGISHMKDEQSELKLMFSLGAAYEQNGDIDRAEAVFEEIIAKAPDHSQSLNYLGYMLADRGERLEYARDLIERAVELAPENAAYLDSYGWVFYRLRKFDKALDLLQKAVSIETDPVIFDHLGDAYNATGDVENARLWWQKALDLQPENEQIKQKLIR